MPLGEWIDSFFGSMEGLLAALLGAAVFLGLYIYSASRLQAERMEMLERIRQSLTFYTQLAGPLAQAAAAADKPENTQEDGAASIKVPPSGVSEAEEHITGLMLECKAADRLTPDLLEQINAYLNDRDASRLPLLSKTLERETNRLVRERSTLLARIEKPGWGLGLWLLLKPAVPGAAFAGAILWTSGLIGALRETGGWMQPEIWCLWLSAMTATLSFFRLLMDSGRPNRGAVFHLLHGLIAAAALPLLFWPEASPYTFATQVMLYLAGFWFHSAPSRKERPFVGHPELRELYAQTAESAAGYESLPDQHTEAKDSTLPTSRRSERKRRKTGLKTPRG